MNEHVICNIFFKLKILFILLALSLSGFSKSDKDSSQYYPNLYAYSYLFNFGGNYHYHKNKSLLLETRVNYNLALYKNFSLSRPDHHLLTLNPGINLRMLDDKMFTVPNPSFLVGIDYYWYNYFNEFNNIKNVLYLSLTHHSNGASEVAINNGNMNTKNGKFSTHYIDIENFFSSSFLPLKNLHHTLGIGIQWHFPETIGGKNIPGSLSRKMEDIFGTKRLKLNYMLDYQQDNLNWFYGSRFIFKIDYQKAIPAPDKQKFKETLNYYKNIPGFIFNAEFMVFPKWKSELGFFMKYHAGQDYYNIYFFNPLSQFQLGIVFNTLNIDKYR